MHPPLASKVLELNNQSHRLFAEDSGSSFHQSWSRSLLKCCPLVLQGGSSFLGISSVAQPLAPQDSKPELNSRQTPSDPPVWGLGWVCQESSPYSHDRETQTALWFIFQGK